MISVSSSLEENNTPLIDTLPKKGTYTLIIFLPKESRIKVGQLGVKSFPKGYYTYTGSALGDGASNLRHRVSRHLEKTGKKMRWHIDFLLAHRDATVTAVVAAQTDRRRECELNCCIKKEGAAGIPIPGFGSSDCYANCRSHLLYFGEEGVEKKIAELYAKKLGFRPTILSLHDQLVGVKSKVSNLS